jgi:hypothetical protein
MIGEQSSPTGVVFGIAVDPLPLIDPSAAARFLGLKRHTLACYRSLGEGPAYYRFGRWIRYASADLQSWHSAVPNVTPAWSRLVIDPAHALTLVDTEAAARFLTITTDCLKNYRKIDTGPRTRRLGRRVYYAVADLCRWAEAQRVEGTITKS